MNLIICDSKNTHIINKLSFDNIHFKLVIVGEKNLEYKSVCKNVKFIDHLHEIEINKYKKYIFLDETQYIDPEIFEKINNLSHGSFFASNFFGDDELYMMQVMGHLPEILTGHWHNEYINRSNLSKTDLKYDFLEKYLFTKNKNIFYFNKYKSLSTRNILITDKINKIKKCILGTKTINEFVKKFSKKENIYLSGNIWYLDDTEDQYQYVKRLYKL